MEERRVYMLEEKLVFLVDIPRCPREQEIGNISSKFLQIAIWDFGVFDPQICPNSRYYNDPFFFQDQEIGEQHDSYRHNDREKQENISLRHNFLMFAIECHPVHHFTHMRLEDGGQAIWVILLYRFVGRAQYK